MSEIKSLDDLKQFRVEWEERKQEMPDTSFNRRVIGEVESRIFQWQKYFQKHSQAECNTGLPVRQ